MKNFQKNTVRLPRISQCMIVKNEEKNIERALSWGKGVVCEQIVVDTGSTDRTVEIAQKMGAKVFHFEWINDFAAAKNYAIEQAKGDWIAFLDADEYILENEAANLPKIVLALGSKSEMHNGIPHYVNVIAMDLVNINSDGSIISSFKQTRLFKNTPAIRYTGAIHEQLQDAINGKLITAILGGMVRIFHTGYGDNLSASEMKEKGERNIALIRQELKKNPDSANMKLYLAESLQLHGDTSEAVKYLKEAVKNQDNSLEPTFLRRAYQNLLYWMSGLISSENTLYTRNLLESYYNEAVSIYPDYPDYDIALGNFMYAHNDYKAAINYLENVLKKGEKLTSSEDTHLFIMLKNIYNMLCSSYSYLDDVANSFKYRVLSLQTDPYQLSSLKHILQILIHSEKADAATSYRFLSNIYSWNDKDKAFLLQALEELGESEYAMEIKKIF